MDKPNKQLLAVILVKRVLEECPAMAPHAVELLQEVRTGLAPRRLTSLLLLAAATRRLLGCLAGCVFGALWRLVASWVMRNAFYAECIVGAAECATDGAPWLQPRQAPERTAAHSLRPSALQPPPSLQAHPGLNKLY